MGVDLNQAQADLAKLCEQRSSFSSLFSIDYDYLSGEWKENAQGYCRGTMFRSIVARILSGDNDFSTIDDPFGEDCAEFRVSGKQNELISDLVYTSKIYFWFGSAGSK